MVDADKKINMMAEQINENLLAVKGTLELMDTSITDDEMHGLLLKAIERTDIVQGLAADMFLFLKKCCTKINELEHR